MKIFTCSACHQVVFFENVQCTKCGHTLAFLPDHATVSALEAEEPRDAAVSSPPGVMVALAQSAQGQRYRLCRNYVEHAACNWAVPIGDDNAFCRACRLNDVIPNLADGHAKEGWRRMERAKRRLLHTLIELGLPVECRRETPGGLAFCFLEDVASSKVFTGHNDGIITINLAEADDPFREKTRERLGETYRTLLGHFRHEIGHYYWDRLIKDSDNLGAYRELFGDEQADYEAALQRHYEHGAPPDWQSTFVSAYASMHPWEDWAETWSHYLHMVDTLETARTYGLAVRAQPETPDSQAPPIAMSAHRLDFRSFDEIINAWFPLTTALNSLNRGMGLADLYPFVLNPGAIRKLRFVHDVVSKASNARSADGRTAGTDAQPDNQRSLSPSSAMGSTSTVTRSV